MEFAWLAVLLILSFILSGSETALTTVNKTKIRLRAEAGDRRAQRVLRLLEHPDRAITSIVIGNTVVNTVMAIVLTATAVRSGWNLWEAGAMLTAAILLVGAVVPKNIAATFSERLSLSLSLPVRLLVSLLTPVTFLLSKLMNAIIRVLSRGAVQQSTLTKEELRTMVDIASTEGTFEQLESERLKGVLDFPNKTVDDVMTTHRTEIVGIPAESTYEEVRTIILENAYSRYPVYGDGMDDIIGLFFSKKLIVWSIDPSRPLADFLDMDPLFVVQSSSVETVYRLMLAKKRHIAIVLDEYGGTLGIVTHEDLIEEMTGIDIEDETDKASDVLVFDMTETKLVCSGRMEICDVNEDFHVRVPDDQHDTIGGFAIHMLGDIPEPGESFDYDNLHFEIDQVERNRIIRMTITVQGEGTDGEGI